MDIEARIHQQFADHIETASHAASLLSPVIAQAASQIVGVLLQGGKLLSCGNGGSGASAQLLAAKMVNQHERERPGLPTIALNNAIATMTSVAANLSFEEVFSKQVGALGHPGDLLFAISCTGRPENILRAIQSAHEKQMQVIVLSGGDGGRLPEVLKETDLEIRIPTQSTARTTELQPLVIHCLCDLIDAQLLGS